MTCNVQTMFTTYEQIYTHANYVYDMQQNNNTHDLQHANNVYDMLQNNNTYDMQHANTCAIKHNKCSVRNSSTAI